MRRPLLPRSLSAPFVVTVSSVSLSIGALACGDGVSKPPESPKTDPSIDPVTGMPATTFRFRPVDRIVSPMDPKSNLPILVDEAGACYVQSGPGGKTAMECPTELKDPAWAQACHDQIVNQRGETCQCEVFANPPYVGQVPCPPKRP